jgi:hypothetical protein
MQTPMPLANSAKSRASPSTCRRMATESEGIHGSETTPDSPTCEATSPKEATATTAPT